MAILDKLLELSDAQAVTTTALTDNWIRRRSGALASNPLVDHGDGKPLYCVVETAVDCTDTGSDATITFTLESDSAEDLSSSPKVHINSGAIPFASFSAAGSRLLAIALPIGQEYKEYLRGRITVGSGPLTAGAFNVYFTTDVQNFRAYANNSVITG